MTSANALAGGWTAVWRVADPKFGSSTPPTGSWSATCGSTTLTGGTIKYEADNLHIKYTLPNTGNVSGKNKIKVPTTNTIERFTNEAICPAKSKLTLTINSWTPASETAILETKGDCVVVMTESDHDKTDVAKYGANKGSK